MELASPFTKLSKMGLLPDRVQPRARVLQETDLPAWKVVVARLGEVQRDFLFLAHHTGLRRNEARELRREQINLVAGVLSLPETKNGKPHSLPITPAMREVLQRRCEGPQAGDELFAGVAAGQMATRAGAPTLNASQPAQPLQAAGDRRRSKTRQVASRKPRPSASAPDHSCEWGEPPGSWTKPPPSAGAPPARQSLAS